MVPGSACACGGDPCVRRSPAQHNRGARGPSALEERPFDSLPSAAAHRSA
jgi:hypothetical protein